MINARCCRIASPGHGSVRRQIILHCDGGNLPSTGIAVRFETYRSKRAWAVYVVRPTGSCWRFSACRFAPFPATGITAHLENVDTIEHA